MSSILAEFTYRMPRKHYLDLLNYDRDAFPTLSALRELARNGNKCAFVALCDSKEQREEVIDGVTWMWSTSIHDTASTINMFDPDVMIVCSAPKVAWSVIKQTHKRFKLFVHLSGELKDYLCSDSISLYNCSSIVCPTHEYEVAILNSVGINARTVAIQKGVNWSILDSEFIPYDQRDYDIACSMSQPFKGIELGIHVMNECEKLGMKIHPWRNMSGMGKRDFITHLAKCRHLFHPTPSEGCCRTVSEAARLGVTPIVSSDSQNVCRQLKDIFHHEVRTWSWHNPTMFKFSYSADPAEVADCIFKKSKARRIPAPNCPPEIPQCYNVKTEIASKVKLITEIMS